MEAEIDVQERDLGVLKIGSPCEVIPDAYPDQVYRGHINRKQPIVNRQRGVVQVKITIDNPDEYVLPNMNARVLLLKDTPRTKKGRDLPEIPLRALIDGSDPPAVFLLDGQTARRRQIEIGARLGDRVQVLKGLQPRDRIILCDDRPLRDGQTVRVREMTPSPVLRASEGSGESDKQERNERKDRS
jgi:multidrug efflux pump subunit AcrA (membrane-fusion protein)